ncbi:MAG: hypothetical protein F6J87_23015 [Spirulina sp. SIO3F2]|nr:hypothetical protein [Spirulina sp. SIO3F2]
MNCLTRLLALGVLTLGTAGYSAAALAALPSAHSSSSEGRSQDSSQLARLIERECADVVVPRTLLYDEDIYNSTGERRTVGSVYKEMKVEILSNDRNQHSLILVRVWNDDGATDDEGYVRERDLQPDSYDCRRVPIAETSIPNSQCALVARPDRLYDRPDGFTPVGVLDENEEVFILNALNPSWFYVRNRQDSDEIGYIDSESLTKPYQCRNN